MTEDKKRKLKRQKDIGQFFTPQEVVEFIYDMLKVHLDKEEKWRTYIGKKRKRLKRPSIIDPACGEGIFLKIVLEKKMTYPSHIFGIDIDEEMKEEWKRINLLTKFGSEARLESRFFHQNGLLPIKHDLKYKYRGIKKNALKEFDLVVGNPPYGGVGLKEITPELEKALLGFDVWRRALRRNDTGQGELFDKHQIETLGDKRKKRLERFPIEVLFVNRFIQLAKPGGHIAVIIPDGILSNANLHYVRKFIPNNVKIDAIVSLPRDTFKNVGTSAKTSILFMTKPKQDERLTDDYKIFLASAQNLENLSKVYAYYKEVSEMNPSKKELVKVINDSQGNELVMVRVDKTLEEMMEEKPGSRWDTLYWHPRYDDLIPLLNKWNAKTLEEIEGKGCIISGDHVRPSRGENKGYNLNTGIEYYETKNFLLTGYDYSKIKECSQNAYERLKYTAVSQYDILISCAGVGGVGKARSCLITHKPKIKSCTGDVFIIRLKELNPFFVYALLNSKVCKNQIMRNRSGVGTENINTDQALHLRMPIMSKNILTYIEKSYNRLLSYHDCAMEAKAKGDEANYKKNIETAEKTLKDLIARTEAVIRGEKDDIV